MKRYEWKVIKIYSHFTFEQSCFKREFVLTNQRKRQEAKSSIEKDFHKLMNNAIFGNDCRDNRNNRKFQPIGNEIEEVTYIKKYYNLFDNNVSKFVNSDILEKQINQEFEQNLSTIKFDDPFRAVKIKSLELVKNEKMDALNCLKEKEKKGGKRKLTKDFERQVSDLIKNKKIKTMIDLNKRESNSIKSIVVNSSTTVDVSTKSYKEKMLMFAQMSLKSFV